MDQKKFVLVMKALAHPNRLELYTEIAKQQEKSFDSGGECLVSDIISRLTIGAPTISHHLKELANAGLISTERKGQFLVARINRNVIDEVMELLSELGSGKMKR